MKGNWINKLIELLNEYDDWMVSWYEEYFPTEWLFVTNAGQWFREEFILGKRYWFIKWLLDNDKIDRHSERLELDMKRMRIPQDYYIGWLQSLDLQHKKAQYLSLIALLSIQDDSVNYLIHILK